MAVATSQYWNSIHGAIPGEVENDAEGLQTVRTLANNMVFLMKSIALGKEKYGLPEREKPPSWNIEVGWVWYIAIMLIATIFKDRVMIWAFATAVFFLWKKGFLKK